jgi:alpha-L-fucosidase
LINKYEPDLLYNDGGMVFPEVHYRLVSHLYNVSAKLHGGKVEAVYTSKGRKDSEIGTCVYDIERGIADQIQPNPWQTDTCIGDWHYKRGVQYKTPKQVIDMLCDIVSRNGNLMLNFPLPNHGELDAQELNVLDGITRWMAVNSEGIHASRPWKIFGDGPGTKPAAAADLRFNESQRRDLSAEDVRFTTKGRDLYAFVMGWPEREAVIKPLATNGQYVKGKIADVQLLGFPGKLKWTQDTDGLKVELFFKWIKQNLRIKHFFGTTDNAVKTQVWIAICVYVLLAMVRKELRLEMSRSQILQILSVNVFEQIPLAELVTNSQLQNNPRNSHNQLMLWDE